MTAADSTTGILSDPKHRVQLRRAVIASTIGTTIEWCDFLLYSIVTGLVFAKLFFPASDPLVGAMQAYAIFFVGFIARPVGAGLFGHWLPAGLRRHHDHRGVALAGLHQQGRIARV